MLKAYENSENGPGAEPEHLLTLGSAVQGKLFLITENYREREV